MLKSIFSNRRAHSDKRARQNTFRKLNYETMDARFLFADLAGTALEPQANFAESPHHDTAEGEIALSPKHNRVNPADVNRDGIVEPVDVLVTINVLQRHGSDVEVSILGENDRAYCDVNGDFYVSPLDVLQVINFLSFSARQSPIAGAGGKTYAIGNSLTNDFFFNHAGKGFDNMTKGTANPTVTGVQLNCSQSLIEIWANPDGTCVTSPRYGKYPEALAGSVDNVLFQPHYGPALADESQAIKNFIELTKRNPANADTRFFVYAPWGTQFDSGWNLSYYDNWHNRLAALAGNYYPSKSTSELLMNDLAQSGLQVTLIPAGHAWISAIDAIRAGRAIDLVITTNGVKSPGTLTEAQLWRDPIHASSVGSFLAAATVYSAIYGKEPVGLDPRLFSYEAVTYDYILTPESARFLEQIAWQAYTSDLYFGP
jgi:Dockerin type I domain